MSFAELRNRQSVTEVVIEGNSCNIEKIPFDTPVKLLSIPEKPEPIDVVLDEISRLPAGEAGDYTPYLEIKVLVSTVDPTIRQRIEEALAEKAVRLANISATSNITREDGECRPMTYEEFKRAEPIELIKEIYKKGKGETMPRHLEQLLTEIIKEVKNENLGNKR